MRLTADEIGVEPYAQGQRDRKWFRNIPESARAYARSKGHWCVCEIISATTLNAIGEPLQDHQFLRFQEDAIMFAKFAHKGWRAYRMMVGE